MTTEPLTNQEAALKAAGIILNVLKKHRHLKYQWTVKYALTCRQIMAGEEAEKLLAKFYRETDEAFNQRKTITQFVVKSVAQNLAKPFNKLFRSQAIQRIITSENDNQRTELIETLNKFWGGYGSYDQWFEDRWPELCFYDPNSFVVFDWDNFDETQQRAEPYPVEITSENALDFEFKKNYLQWLCAKIKENTYAVYLPDMTVIAVKLDQKVANIALTTQEISIDENGAGFIKHEDSYYQVVTMTPHNLGQVPAMRAGYRRNPIDNGVTLLSPIDEAFPILIKSISTGSELDLAIRLHVFPQKLQYLPPCAEPDCRGGLCSDGSICKTCKGTGKDVHTSSQDIISLNMPMTKDEMVALAELVHYVQLPMEIVTFLNEYIKGLYNQSREAIFNSDIFTRQEIAETATGQNIAIQNLYDTLYPMAQSYAQKWEWGAELIADITDLDEGVTITMTFGRDFKLKSLDELYSELKTVSESGASPFIKRAIEDDVARIVYVDNDMMYLKYKAMQIFNPFSGKSDQEVISIMSSQNTTQFNKVLYANMTSIFDLIEVETPDFYMMPRSKQKGIIDEKVNALVADIKAETPKSLFNPGK